MMLPLYLCFFFNVTRAPVIVEATFYLFYPVPANAQ